MNFEGLLEVLPDAALLIAPDGSIRYASPAVEKVLGYHPAELVGEDFEVLIVDRDQHVRRELTASHARCPESRAASRALHVSGRHKDGASVPLNICLAPIAHSGGPVTLALIRDLTETHAREVELLRSQRFETLGRLTTGVAHDFNNLLTVISGGAGTLLDVLPDGHAGRAEATVILEAGRRAASLTHHLLSVARRQPRAIAPVNVNEIVTGMETILSRVLGDDIEIVLRLQEDMELVWADPDEIGQVVMNLAVNAREAMPDGGTLTFATESTQGPPGESDSPYLQLRVSDTGIGMDPVDQARIFEPFFTTKDDGTGLGLSTVRDIVERFGGTVMARSTPGEGAEFLITLPLAVEVGAR